MCPTPEPPASIAGGYVSDGRGDVLKGVQVVRRLLRPARCREDRALVVLQDRDLRREVAAVIGARFGRYAQVGTQEGAAQLGDQLLKGIGGGTEALAEVAREAAVMAGPVGQFVDLGRGVALGIDELLDGRQVDAVLGVIE